MSEVAVTRRLAMTETSESVARMRHAAATLDRLAEFAERQPLMTRTGVTPTIDYEFEVSRLLVMALNHNLAGVCNIIEGCARLLEELERLTNA